MLKRILFLIVVCASFARADLLGGQNPAGGGGASTLSNVASNGPYGGPNGVTVIVSSAVPICQEWENSYTTPVTSVTFRQATSFSSHTAVGFYDSSCNFIQQSTVTLSNGQLTVLFSPSFSMTGNTKYFVCMAVDANAVQFTSTNADSASIYSVLANDGEPATNYHVFKMTNASTVNAAGTATILPATCGTRINYSPGTISTVGYVLH